MNLSDVYVFKKVANTLSFTKAARQIGVTRSTVSKQVSRLERDLGVMLLNRSTRSVNLTEAGRSFDANTGDIDTTIDNAANIVRGADLSPLGTVSFTVPTALGATLMPSLITQFQKSWPELRLNIQVSDQFQDIIADNCDLAIRVCKSLPDSSLIARRLASTRLVLAASPGYLNHHGMPSSFMDLANHQCLCAGSAIGTNTNWQFLKDGKVTSVETTFALTSNNNLTLILAACLDSGIILIPEISIAGELARKQLQIIPTNADPDFYGIYALYPHRNAAAKVKVLVDFIDDKLAKLEGVDRWDPLSEYGSYRLATVSDLDQNQSIKYAN